MATTTARTISRRRLYPEERLPESDGKPMAETDVHRDQMIDLLHALKEFFRNDQQIYVTGNIFFYYRDEINELQSVSPDIFVVRGVKKKERRIYNLDVERKAPDVVIELTSQKTKAEDLGTKRFIYASLGVREYFIFDPTGETIRPALRGFRIEAGEYVPITQMPLHSKALGLELRVEQNRLRLYDAKTGERLRTHTESETERRLAEKKAVRESNARQKAEAMAEEQANARRTTEAENLRLREELAKLRGK